MTTTPAAEPLAEITEPTLRVLYLIPSNRTPQASAVPTLKFAVTTIQDWMRTQMVLAGYGPMTFGCETDADGTPKIHVVNVTYSDSDIRLNIWDNACKAAVEAGIPLWQENQVWLIVTECHLQNADGTISGVTALGSSAGGSSGIAMLSSTMLPFMDEKSQTDQTPYNGRVVSAIGPRPLIQSISFPWFEGETFASLWSSYIGAAAHEIGHALGLAHDFRSDVNASGNLMGCGLRGIRASNYGANHTRLTADDAKVLSLNRQFTNSTPDHTSCPVVSLPSPPWRENGVVNFPFAASDDAGLEVAQLIRDGAVVSSMRLSGTSGDFVMTVPDAKDAKWNELELAVWNVNGGKSSATTANTFNNEHAPHMFE